MSRKVSLAGAVLISRSEYERLRAKRVSPAAAFRAWHAAAPEGDDGFDLPPRDASEGREVSF